MRRFYSNACSSQGRVSALRAMIDLVDDDRARLDAERADVLRRLGDTTSQFDEVVAASRDTNADDEHDPEGATIAFERSQLAAHAVHLRERLGEIDAALARLEAGDYGRCTRCGGPIGAARLQARPASRTCIGCASGTNPVNPSHNH